MAASKKVADPSVPFEGCNIFDKLRDEMRNKIWALSFTNNDQVVDFRDPSPPTKSLLLTCKKPNSEARDLYQDAYRAYWTTSPFQITIVRQESNETRKWWAALDGFPEYRTLLLHRRDITDLAIILVDTEDEKTLHCVEEHIFLDVKGVCKAAIKPSSNIQAF